MKVDNVLALIPLLPLLFFGGIFSYQVSLLWGLVTGKKWDYEADFSVVFTITCLLGSFFSGISTKLLTTIDAGPVGAILGKIVLVHAVFCLAEVWGVFIYAASEMEIDDFFDREIVLWGVTKLIVLIATGWLWWCLDLPNLLSLHGALVVTLNMLCLFPLELQITALTKRVTTRREEQQNNASLLGKLALFSIPVILVLPVAVWQNYAFFETATYYNIALVCHGLLCVVLLWIGIFLLYFLIGRGAMLLLVFILFLGLSMATVTTYAWMAYHVVDIVGGVVTSQHLLFSQTE